MAILFHPTHRKFIKLLRLYADRGTIVNITNLDQEKFSDLLHRTNNSLRRHKAIYKLLLEILSRNTPPEEGHPFTHEMVDTIERSLAHAERSKPCATFRGAAIKPFLQFLLRRLKKQ